MVTFGGSERVAIVTARVHRWRDRLGLAWVVLRGQPFTITVKLKQIRLAPTAQDTGAAG